MQPSFNSSGKYPSFKHRFVIWERIGEIMWLQDSNTDFETTYRPFPLSFKSVMAFEISEDLHGEKKNEL